MAQDAKPAVEVQPGQPLSLAQRKANLEAQDQQARQQLAQAKDAVSTLTTVLWQIQGALAVLNELLGEEQRKPAQVDQKPESVKPAPESVVEPESKVA